MQYYVTCLLFLLLFSSCKKENNCHYTWKTGTILNIDYKNKKSISYYVLFYDLDNEFKFTTKYHILPINNKRNLTLPFDSCYFNREVTYKKNKDTDFYFNEYLIK